MPSIRNRKKEAIRNKILEAAKECFLTDGFAETTIADIAARANIGVGTLYNYFPSKALLYMQSYYLEIGNPSEKLDDVISKFGNDPAMTVIKIIEVYLEPYKTFEKNTTRELFVVFMDSITKHPELGEVYTKNKYLFIDFIAKILEAYQEKWMLETGFDTRDAAFCVFSILTTQALFFMMNDSITYDEMQNNILRQIKLFFQGKIKQKGGRK
ncbi:MAG: hypothetical protein APF84_04715 [Gracilibacter sp. BRH_c7a]|nr:MAG: hypothetical protein APF84_04715 [Gracilibacter sp. BRH_c7a]